jgi:hypothetical protein
VSNTTILLPRAELEIKEAWIWYEEKQEERGNKFQIE